jgi:hypothetical protein
MYIYNLAIGNDSATERGKENVMEESRDAAQGAQHTVDQCSGVFDRATRLVAALYDLQEAWGEVHPLGAPTDPLQQSLFGTPQANG